MGPSKAVPLAGNCQNCSALVSTMLKGGGVFKPTALVSEPSEDWCLWPIAPDCKICKIISSSRDRSTKAEYDEPSPPGIVKVRQVQGPRDNIRAVFVFQAISAAGPTFDFVIWSRNGEVRIPASDASDQVGYIPISTRAQLESQYGKKHFKLVQSWLRICQEHHKVCKKNNLLVVDKKNETVLPTRLIDISRIVEGIVTLVNKGGARGNYSALSYCWGKNPGAHIKTTISTISKHQTGIKIDDLPQVFKDAIRVTGEVGLRYLWADSLCIIQDDPEDWKAEAGRMSEVYRNADIVIAAAGASDPSQGCFIHRQIPLCAELQIATVPDTIPKTIWIQEAPFGLPPSSGPLQKRGWTLQETYLALRSVHFMPSGMYWDCEELETAETTFGTPIVPRLGWLVLLHTFSFRHLTKKEDRLFAVQGLILWSMMRTFDDDDVEVEIWEDMPSWSWACISGHKWLWFMEPTHERSESDIELLKGEDVLRFRGWSSVVHVGDAVDESHDLTDYEKVAINTAADWRIQKLYTMFQRQGNTHQAVGFAGPDTDAVPLGDVTILFIAERTWNSVYEERDKW
ncbi:hypothetical protein NW768_004931 [Fusarium equiseti]|uniref:Heterokaryon incompatibility domain-containing protein n=1 Tax=Fusarium equiseti TaxID=61235 RepID=A0ABQ8RHT7_FUSEQ|nr:hypothetical protein NW768_004931 [Fusarium equiseti]